MRQIALRIGLALALAVSAVAPAAAQQTISQLLSLIATDLPTNGVGSIPAANVRSVLNALVNSTNVAGSSCPTTALSTYQPFANTAGAPTNIALSVFDGVSCVQWATLNGSTHNIVGALQGLIVGPAVGTGQGLFVNQDSGTSNSIAGATGFPFYYLGGPYFVYNNIQVKDQLNVTGVHVMAAALAVGMEVGGANSQGSKFAFEASIVHDIAGSNPSASRDKAAGNFDAYASVPEGGTGLTVGTAKGTLFAVGLQATLASGATNVLTVSGGEINAGISTGASAYSRLGMSAVGTGNLPAASVYDAGFEISSFATSGAQWKTGLLFSTFHGGQPVTSSGTLIGTDGTAITAAIGIDFSSATFSTCTLKFAAGCVVNASGIVPLAFGGTNAALTADNGGIVWSNASQLQILAHTTTANLPLLSGNAATPSWAAVSHPTSAISGGIPYFSSTSVMASSALLAANCAIYGGGAGTAPATSTSTCPTISSAGAVNIQNATASTTTGTGSLVLGGGLGMAGDIHMGGSLFGVGFSLTAASTITSTAQFIGYALTNGTNQVAALQCLAVGCDNGALILENGGAIKIEFQAATGVSYFNTGQNLCIGATSCGSLLTVAGSMTSSSSSAGLGYSTGAGGAVTQTASRTTAVTLNTITGDITLVSAAGSATFASFVVNNSSVGAHDMVHVNQLSGADKYQIFVTAIAGGTSFTITFATTGGTTTEQPVFHFNIIKGVNSFLLKRDIDPAANDNSPAFMEKVA